MCILSREHCEVLGLIKRIEMVKIQDDDSVFKGLGLLKNYEYDIDLKEGAKFSIYVPRRIPYPFKNYVKREIDLIVKLGILKSISEPTQL